MIVNERYLGFFLVLVGLFSLFVIFRGWTQWAMLKRIQQVLGTAGFLLWGLGYLLSAIQIRFIGMLCVIIQGIFALLILKRRLFLK